MDDQEEKDNLEDRVGELVEQALSGDQEAVARLYRLYESKMIRAAHFKLGHTLHGLMESMDLVQSVWKDALDNLQQFEYRGPDSFYKWLHSCLINKIQSKRRYHGAEKRDAKKVNRLHTEAGITSPTPEASGDPTPSRVAMGHEEMQEVFRILETFTEDQRKVMILRMKDELGYVEIASRIDKSVEATKKLFHRGMKKLLEQLPEAWRGMVD
ncbi:MAG: RNA polymerase sigma factor [Planctomycetota bacterium]|jgi:RNA polymerase sigma factor (sigma-70 family)